MTSSVTVDDDDAGMCDKNNLVQQVNLRACILKEQR